MAWKAGKQCANNRLSVSNNEEIFGRKPQTRQSEVILLLYFLARFPSSGLSHH